MTHHESGILSTDSLLDESIAVSLEERFQASWPDLSRNRQFDDEEDERDDYDGCIAREKSFVAQVLGTTRDLADQRQGPVTILFDLDETLVKSHFAGDDTMTSVLRPGFVLAMETLHAEYGEQIDFGILTSRGESHLLAEKQEPSLLRGVIDHPMLNADFVVSSRQGSSFYERPDMEDAEDRLDKWNTNEALACIRGLVSVALATAVEKDDWSTLNSLVRGGHWYDPKLAIVDRLAAAHPERGFVFVDDLPFPASIDSQHPQVRGVSLGRKAMFSV